MTDDSTTEAAPEPQAFFPGTEENLRILAAAPQLIEIARGHIELVEALIAALADFPDQTVCDSAKVVLGNIKAVVAKATGEAE